jgi:hypothetical protein
MRQAPFQMLSEIEAGGTHQIAHVLDEEEVESVQRKMVQGVVHHVGVEMAGRTGGDLPGGDTMGPDALGIVLRLQVALDHTDPVFVFQGVDGRLQQRSLARARRRIRLTANTPWRSKWARLCAAIASF